MLECVVIKIVTIISARERCFGAMYKYIGAGRLKPQTFLNDPKETAITAEALAR
jgi:hypothetical protein